MKNQETHTYFNHNNKRIELQDFTFWRDLSGTEHYRAKYKNKIIEATDFREWRSKLIQLLDEEAVEVREE